MVAAVDTAELETKVKEMYRHVAHSSAGQVRILATRWGASPGAPNTSTDHHRPLGVQPAHWRPCSYA